MSTDNRDRRQSRTKIIRVAAVASGTWCLAVGGLYAFETLSLHVSRNATEVGNAPARPLQEFAMPGIAQPVIVATASSRLRDEDEVIGVEVGGHPRAYRLDAFRDRSAHVVNDLVGDVPVSIAYCDISDCLRAYTGEGVEPLGLSVGGLLEAREMVLDLGGTLYLQGSGAVLSPGPKSGVEAGSLPLRRVEPRRTTWRQWRKLHPTTDVYEGIGTRPGGISR